MSETNDTDAAASASPRKKSDEQSTPWRACYTLDTLDALADAGVSDGACRVLFVLGGFADERGEAFPSWETLQKKSKRSRPALAKAIRELKDTGFLQVVNPGSGGRAAVYRVYGVGRLDADLRVSKMRPTPIREPGKGLDNETHEGIKNETLRVSKMRPQRYPINDTPINKTQLQQQHLERRAENADNKTPIDTSAARALADSLELEGVGERDLQAMAALIRDFDVQNEIPGFVVEACEAMIGRYGTREAHRIIPAARKKLTDDRDTRQKPPTVTARCISGRLPQRGVPTLTRTIVHE